MHELQAVETEEDVRGHEVVCSRAGVARAQPGDPGGELQLAVISEHGYGSRELACVGAEGCESMQDETADGGRPPRLHLVRGGRRRLDSRRLESPQQLTEKKRVSAGRGVACPAERLGGIRSESLPRESQRRRRA